MTKLPSSSGTVDGVAYTVSGEGPPVVLLRGLGRSVRHWLGYEQTLAQKLRVITVELRGVGAVPAPLGWGATIFDFANDVVAVLDRLGIETAHVAGISLGGMITLATGMRHAERCRSLIVMNTSVAGLRTARITPTALRAIANAARWRDDRFHEQLVDALVGKDCPAERRRDVARHYATIAAEEGLYVGGVVKQLAAAGRFLVKRQLTALRLPTLVIYGTDDRFVPNVNSRKVAALVPGAELLPIAGAGHELSVDKGAELATAIESWIGRQELPQH